jgi:hypothetical protein
LKFYRFPVIDPDPNPDPNKPPKPHKIFEVAPTSEWRTDLDACNNYRELLRLLEAVDEHPDRNYVSVYEEMIFSCLHDVPCTHDEAQQRVNERQKARAHAPQRSLAQAPARAQLDMESTEYNFVSFL